MRPHPETYPSYFENYIGLVTDENLSAPFDNSMADATSLIESIPEEKGLFAYAEGKWTIKEVIQHITDAERVFAYRALAIARKDEANLPGFDENSYAANSAANHHSITQLLAEWKAVRLSSQLLFELFNEQQLHQMGTANGKSISVLALGYTIVGHGMHHINILRNKYL